MLQVQPGVGGLRNLYYGVDPRSGWTRSRAESRLRHCPSAVSTDPLALSPPFPARPRAAGLAPGADVLQ